jgi:hypothetical protein
MSEIVQIVRELIPGAEIRLGPPDEQEKLGIPHVVDRIKEEFGFSPRNTKQGIRAWIN